MEEKQTLAYEIYLDLKKKCRRRKRIIFLLSAIIILLTAVLVASPTVVKTTHKTGTQGAQERIKYTDFTVPECERFRQLCNFTDEERIIFDVRVKENLIAAVKNKIEDKGVYLSESTIKRRLNSIKKKIIKVM